jgi:hypothetical protein
VRRLFLTLFGALILAIGAGSVPAAAASPATAIPGSPQCSTWDDYGSRVCVALVSSTFVGQATVHAYPSNCAGYRVYLIEYQTDRTVASTSLRPCSESPSKQVTADASRFSNLAAFAEFVMFDSAGNVITYQDTAAIYYS